MVKRRRLETPSTADLDRIEERFRSETPHRGIAPIAQVAAETAAHLQPEGAEQRIERAAIEADAARLRAAQEQGLLMAEIPLDEIDESAIIRDRMTMSDEAITELRQSIAAHGLRLPIEVFELESPSADGPRYGLLSGYRRYLAVRALAELTGADSYRRIRALIRPRFDSGGAFVQMIEENEVREQLSHFERGRIAVIAANQGAFANTEDAVDKLFATGSKAKRSKIRSFALIFEELGDMLHYPEGLTERRGLALASALRRGAEGRLRDALAGHSPTNADEEWAVLEPAINEIDPLPRSTSRGGRPKAPLRFGWIDERTIRTSSGITIRRATDSKGHILRFEGTALSSDLMESLMLEIQSLLER